MNEFEPLRVPRLLLRFVADRRRAMAIATTIALLLANSAAHADVTWNWSFSGEQGTFRTDGVFSDTASANTFSYLEGTFDVTGSSGGAVQPTDPTALPYFAVGSDPVAFTPGDLIWSGTGLSAFSVPGSLSPMVFQGNASSSSPLRPYIYRLQPGLGQFLEWSGSTFNQIASGSLTVTPAPQGEYTIQLDRFEIAHSGGTTFVDDFDDGTPPPSVGYSMVGAMGPEAGGVLTIDELDAVAAQIPGVSTQVAIQLIPAGGAPFSDSIVVKGLYELDAPHPSSAVGQSVFLTYVDPANFHAHTVIAALQSNAGFSRSLMLTDFDAVDMVPIALGSLDVSALFAGTVDQVELVLTAPANSGFVNTTLNVYNGGVLGGSVTLPQVASLLGSASPSAGFQVYVPEPGLGALYLGIGALFYLAKRATVAHPIAMSAQRGTKSHVSHCAKKETRLTPRGWRPGSPWFAFPNSLRVRHGLPYGLRHGVEALGNARRPTRRG